MFALFFLAVLLDAAPAVGTPRVVSFPGGQAVIEQRSGYEHVVIKGQSGNIKADSDCDATTGTFDEVARLAQAFKGAVQRNDRNALAALMSYPLRVNTGPGSGYLIKSRASLLKQYVAVFTADEVGKIERLEPYSVFCRSEMSTAGDGLFWAQVSGRGNLRIAVINNGRH